MDSNDVSLPRAEIDARARAARLALEHLAVPFAMARRHLRSPRSQPTLPGSAEA